MLTRVLSWSIIDKNVLTKLKYGPLFVRGLRLFKGLFLFFLPNVPGAMFIQGGTLIPDSRVMINYINNSFSKSGSCKPSVGKSNCQTLLLHSKPFDWFQQTYRIH